MDTEHSAITEPVRRIEVFTGSGRRRTWSIDDKVRIVAERLTGGESVCAVARCHGLSPQQLFGWRRQARQSLEATGGGEDARLFVPAVVAAPLPALAGRSRERKRARRADGISMRLIARPNGRSRIWLASRASCRWMAMAAFACSLRISLIMSGDFRRW